jgi:O6-methylguanine-DNA--protein-cysteine methyltransferase
MNRFVKYTIFPTKWGYFALAAGPKSLLRTYLPTQNKQKLEKNILAIFPNALKDNNLLPNLQKQVCCYFNGQTIKFDPNIPLDLNHLTKFTQRVGTPYN